MTEPGALRKAIEDADVVVIGGGLAGLAAAWRLSEAGRTVVVLEASNRFGGKAGSESMDSNQAIRFGTDDEDLVPYNSDHGYHLFPDWYSNVRALMDDAVIPSDVFVRGQAFTDVVRQIVVWPVDEPDDNTPAALGLLGAASVSRRRWQSTCMLLGAATLVGLPDGWIEDKSLAQVLRVLPPWIGRPALEGHRSMVLKALAGSGDDTSARSLARMFRRWIRPGDWNPYEGSWYALNGPLSTVLIEPIRTTLAARPNVDLFEEAPVAGLGRDVDLITSLRIGHDSFSVKASVVLAVPPDRAAELLSEPLGGTAVITGIEDIAETMMEPMSAVDLVFNVSAGEPETLHFGFDRSMLELTAYDISLPPDEGGWEQRPAEGGRMVLQTIATRTGWLERAVDDLIPDGTDEQRATLARQMLAAMVRGDVERHLTGPAAEDAVRAAFVHLNFDAKLVLPKPEIHASRPDRHVLENLWLAGDWLETSIDVASMEAAVESGFIAAGGVLGQNIPTPPGPTPIHRALAGIALAVAWAPVAVVALLARRFKR